MNQKHKASLYVSQLSSLASSARTKNEAAARSVLLQMLVDLKEDLFPPFDSPSVLMLCADLYHLSLRQKSFTTDRDEERFFDLISSAIEGLPRVCSAEYDLGYVEELISLCAKKSRTSHGTAYLACVRSLLSVVGNTL